MSDLRRDALSKLDENSSPFVETKTQKLFRNKTNVTLTGHTYDAKHMDQFLQRSKFGDCKSMLTVDLEASVIRNKSCISHLPEYLVSTDCIKPSTSFLN
jgi:hypothetical protein